MATVSVQVRIPRGRPGDILIELFGVAKDFKPPTELKARSALANLKLERLGSAVTDGDGLAIVTYGDGTAKEERQNLWLIASGVSGDGATSVVHFERDVRIRAASVEHFVIRLPAEPTAPAVAPTPTAEEVARTVVRSRADARVLASHLRAAARVSHDERARVRDEFHRDIAPQLIRELSTVVRDADGKPTDPDFVEPTAPIRTHWENRVRAVLAERFQTNAREPLELDGRLALTDAQIDALRRRGVDPGTNTVTIDAAELDAIVRNTGGIPAPDRLAASSITRIETIRDFCRPPSRARACLDSVPNDEQDEDEGPSREDDADHGEDHDATPGSTGSGGASGGGEASTISAAELKSRVPAYLARVLDETAAIGDGIEHLKGPGSQLSEEDIRARSTFPSLRMPPGPADVPAVHEFHRLQIAFRPVWTEALDQSLLAAAAAAYDRYVDLGGDPQPLRNGLHWQNFVGTLGTLLTPTASPPPARVVAHIGVGAEEWSGLPAEYQRELEALASKIEELQGRLQRDSLGDDDFADGLDDDDRRAYDGYVDFVTKRTQSLREQAERLMKFARDELERRAATESTVPSHRILTELKSRALSQYPARWFAASRSERSVNFGLLVTYAQTWTPVAYQVGDLVQSMPLAPRESRKWQKKVVVKEKRARKEMEANLQAQKSESQSTSRAEAEIVQKAQQKTNYNATVSGAFRIGVYDASGSNTLTADTQSDSAETKKSFHEAVIKAAREYRNETRIEIETENSMESEYQESGEISNPNEEITVTYLFYELQRRYRVQERLHRLTSVVFVAQEMPSPAEIDEDWLIAHRWILNRVLLDDSFKQPLNYVAEFMVAEEHALAELKRGLRELRTRVDGLKGDVLEGRTVTESRYGALQRSMERTARAAQRSSDDGGLFGLAKKFTGVGAAASLAGRLFGSESESPEAARVREGATRDAYEREIERLRDLEGRLAQESNALAVATKEFTNRLSAHLGNVVRVTELVNHVKDNILHYMQAKWLHEAPDQRWLRLKDVAVPDLSAANARISVSLDPLHGSLANVAHRGTRSYATRTRCGTVPVAGTLPTVALSEIADLDDLLGFKANYMIFAMKKPNALTSFMMAPYVERAAASFGIVDPDDLGNISLDEFGQYVCCLRRKLTVDEFAKLKDTLEAQLATLLQAPLRDNEEIVVPLDALYIEALPGAHPVLENFKLLHRQIDAADAAENLQLKRLEKARYVQRLLDGELDDPSVTSRYVFEGAPGATILPPAPGGGGPPP